MRRGTPQKNAGAEIFYRCVIWCYPPGFRREYGREMMITFRECHREVLEQRSFSAQISFWQTMGLDLATSLWRENLHAFVLFFKRLSGLEKEYAMASLLPHFNVASLTDIGRVRSANEDKLLSYVPEDPEIMQRQGALFIVADGMGGLNLGDVASDLAVSTIREAYYKNAQSDPITALREAVEQANLVVYQRSVEESSELSDNKKMGTTCVAAVIKEDQIYLANVGDSLAYIINGNEMKQIAENHSWEVEQVREGKMTLQEAKAEGKGNVITRALGVKAEVEVYTVTEQVQNGDLLLLCTDGLHTLISDDEIRTIVEQYGSEESAAQLIERANADGGPDNITALIARVSLV